CLDDASVAGSARTPRWRARRAAIPNCSSSGAQSVDATERFANKSLDFDEVSVGILVAGSDVMRARHDPQFLGFVGGLEQRVGVTNRHDLIQCAVGEQDRAWGDAADDV